MIDTWSGSIFGYASRSERGGDFATVLRLPAMCPYVGSLPYCLQAFCGSRLAPNHAGSSRITGRSWVSVRRLTFGPSRSPFLTCLCPVCLTWHNLPDVIGATWHLWSEN